MCSAQVSLLHLRPNPRSDTLLGEKVVPLPQEGHLVACPIVMGAVMFGRARTQCGLLVEPHPDHAVDPTDEAALVAFRNKIWYVLRASCRITMCALTEASSGMWWRKEMPWHQGLQRCSRR